MNPHNTIPFFAAVVSLMPLSAVICGGRRFNKKLAMGASVDRSARIVSMRAAVKELAN